MGSKTAEAGGRATAETYVALLRGINVGGKNVLPMKALVVLLGEAGCADVTTYIQSGNSVFRARPALARELPRRLGAAIAERFGLRVPVVVRSASDLKAVAAGNPFLDSGADPVALHVAFLADRPDPASVAALDPARSPPDEFAVRGREIYLRCPNGLARTRLTNQYFDSRLATTCTVRNWATVLKLVELSGGSLASSRPR